eukprot:7403260-Heterocapsa_arctica.AAC.1
MPDLKLRGGIYLTRLEINVVNQMSNQNMNNAACVGTRSRILDHPDHHQGGSPEVHREDIEDYMLLG